MNRETLEQYYGIASNIEAIDWEITKLYNPVSSPQGRQGVRGSTPSSPTEASAMRIIHLREMVEAERARLYALAEEIETWLTTCDDKEITAIVRWHYLLRLNWSRTNIKVYGYPDYDYSRKKIERYFNGKKRDDR